MKIAVIVVVGPPVAAVLTFEVVLNGMTMFNHGNIKIPLTADKWLRWFLVTMIVEQRLDNLFTYRDLWEWIDSPFDVLPVIPGPVTEQLQSMYFDQVQGRREQHPEWLTPI